MKPKLGTAGDMAVPSCSNTPTYVSFVSRLSSSGRLPVKPLTLRFRDCRLVARVIAVRTVPERLLFASARI